MSQSHNEAGFASSFGFSFERNPDFVSPPAVRILTPALAIFAVRWSRSCPSLDPTQRQCRAKPFFEKEERSKPDPPPPPTSFTTVFKLYLPLLWSVQSKETIYLFVQFHETEAGWNNAICFAFISIELVSSMWNIANKPVWRTKSENYITKLLIEKDCKHATKSLPFAKYDTTKNAVIQTTSGFNREFNVPYSVTLSLPFRVALEPSRLTLWKSQKYPLFAVGDFQRFLFCSCCCFRPNDTQTIRSNVYHTGFLTQSYKVVS